MAKFTDEAVAKQIAYRVKLIAKYRAAGKDELADKQQAYHDQRVELSQGERGNSAFWIPAYELDTMRETAEVEEEVEEELGTLDEVAAELETANVD